MIMSFGDFFLQSNNGKKIGLNFKGKLKREDFAGNQKLLKIFDYFDSDKSGVIENLTKDGKNEIFNIFAHIKQTAELREGEGNTVVDSQEAISLTSFVKNLKGVTANELFEFLKIAEEKKNVVEKETVEVSSDGTKTVVSTLQDGSVETDVFYPSGELKLRVTETPITEDFTKGEKITTFDSEIVEKKGGNGKKEELSLVRGAKEGRIILKNDSAKYLSEKYNKEVASAYYKNGVMELRDKNDKPVMRVAVDISPKVEQELREFVGKHLKESSENVLQLAKTAGWIDKLGIDLQDISINKAKLTLSILNPALLLTALEANGKEKLEGYLNQLRENVKNGELLESGATTKGAFDSRFERMTGHSEVNFLQIERLRQTADKYNNVQGLNQRIVLLNQGIKEVKQLYQNYRAQKQGVPNSGKLNSNFDGKILEILTQFFNGDEDVAKALIQTISKGITSKDDLFRKFNAVLTTIKQKASETKSDLLKGESEEELKARYENEYKAMYGQDAVFKAEELITHGKETGGMIQIGMMTAAQMLLAAATMGTGNAALMALQSNALIGFLSTVGTDYALSLSNILSSERGFTAEAQEELHQRTLGTAEFIGFGMVAANPLSRAVGKYASKLFASDAEKVLEGAFAQEVKAGTNAVTRTTTGALTKTTLSLDSALEWVVVKGSEFGTEILSFSGFELLQQDEEFNEVVKGQASTLTKLKVMNAALQVMLGSFVRNQALRGQSKLVVKECNKMLKDMGIEGGKLTENKRPGGSNYTLEINGETKTFKDIKELQANFMSVLAENYIKTRQIPDEIKNLDNDALVSEFTQLIQKQDALTESENARLVDLYQELQNRGLGVNDGVNDKVKNNPTPKSKISTLPQREGEGTTSSNTVPSPLTPSPREGNGSMTAQRYTKPITPYTEAGNKIHELKSSKPEENPQLIAEIKADIEALRKTDPQKADELQIVLEMFTNPTVVSEVTDAQIDAVVNYLNDHYSHLEGYLNEQVGEIGINDPKYGRFGHRIKGEASTHDKVANFIKDAIKEEQKAKEKGEEYTPKTLLSAFKDVRDKYACRTVFELGDFTKHPEVKVLIAQAKTLASEGKPELAAAKMHEAEFKAAELQSEPVRLQILEAMRRAKEEGKDLKAVRISNYYSENGIPIFTPEQMESLKLEAAQMGIDVEFIRLAKEIDPKATTEFVDGASTKKQPSGYTALQINFETKTGEVIEWQYRGELVNEFAEAEHLPYDLRTGKHPWAQYPELEALYKPIAELIDEHVMPKHAYKQLNKYFTDYYTHLRRLELGFESKEPKLSDYENYTDTDGIKRSYKFDKRLEAKNLMALHYYGEGIKDGTITQERAVEEFSRELIQAEQAGSVDKIKDETDTSILNNARYEMSRVVNRGKRVASYVSEKTKGFLKGSKKVVRGLSNLADFALMNVKLKRLGIKDSRSRFEIEEKLKNSNFESEEIRSQIINSIKTLKTMKVRDWEIDNMLFQLEKIENGERILDKTSLEIISEMEKLYQKTSSDWNEFTFCKLTLDSIEDGNNVEVLNKVKDLNLAVDRGYTLEDAEQNMRMGIRGEKNINLYEDILKSPVTASIVGGLGIEYTSREIFNTCKNSQKEVVPENWELLQQFSKELLEFAPYSRHFEIFKTLKNDDIEITKQNLKTFIDAYKADTRSVKIGSLGGCITKEGKLDLSMMGDAENAGRLGVDSKDLKNPDGTYNQNAIKYIQALRDAGFNDNISFNNIINLARSAAAKQKLEGEIYSKEVIDTAIELKEYGIKDDVISHIIKLATRKGIVDKELLELYKPFGMVLKTEDLYTLEQGIGDMLTYGNSEYRPQIVSQMIHLLKNGLSLHEIAMSNIFTHEGADGNIVTADVLKGLVQLKQNDFYAGNLQEVLDSCRKPDGSINQEILNTFVELKKQGFDEFYLKHIISTATNSKGELNKDNLNLTLQLMKEFKGSEFCRDKDEVYMTQLLMEICTDKSGNVDKKLLNECKNSLPDLFKMVAEEDKGSFRYILDRALTPDGKFDKHVIEKINELKNLDDNVRYPNEINIAGRFIDACKDSDGNFSIDMYNDGVMLVKKYGFTKHEVSYKLAPYEDFKSYKNKNNIYDLSLQGKRQLQSLLLRYNSNTSTLQGLKKMLKSDLLPSTDSEYAKIMKQLSQSLGQTDFVLNNIELNQMNTDIARLAKALVTNESAGEVKISTTYDELLKQIQSKMSGLSESEKLKIYDYFGFTVKDGKIIGFPSANGKSIENSDITNSFSKKVVEALTKMVNDYNKNTQITVEGNPELSRILTSLSQTMPEILNKFSNPVIAKQTIQTIQKISKTEDFVKLNEQDKIILIVATLLKDTNIGSLRESAYHIHTMSAKFSWNKTDREKLYSLLIVPERIEEYNNSNPDKVITRNIRHTTIKSNEREEAIDMFAFTIKDRSLDKMSYLLYADKISPELKTELKKRIYEIKKDDFILPQLSMDNLDKYVVEEEHNGHKVKVVHASRVPDLFVFIHTPEAGIINYASRTTKLSNFEEFSNIDNDAVICASYVSSSQFGAFRKHGLVFKVPTGHEYVGMSYDMTSLGKNTREMVAEYYRNKGLKAGQGKGMKYAHRTFVSMKLKNTLHITEHSYSELLKSRHELLAQLKEIKDTSSPEYQNIRNQIVKINKELKKIDDDYVARMDKVKERCTSEQISLSDIKDVDPTLAKAFEEFLSKTNQDYNTDALMRKDFWNEVLVNEMTVVGEYTVAIDKMPEEYLIKSETEGTYIIDFSR